MHYDLIEDFLVGAFCESGQHYCVFLQELRGHWLVFVTIPQH